MNTVFGSTSSLPTHIHFVGIGGIGMSGLAQFCLQEGLTVQGSTLCGDEDLLHMLHHQGGTIFRDHQTGRLGSSVECVVISSAIDPDNPEIREARHKGIPILHRSDFLREILKPKKVLAVSGTHGKTTTTSLLGSVLDQAFLDPLIFSGGIMFQYQGNVRLSRGPWAVVEADESDKSFLNFATLWGAIVTNIEAEHMENYGSFQELLRHFRLFLEKASEGGVLCWDDAHLRSMIPELSKGQKIISYGLTPGATLQGHHVRWYPDHMVFDVEFTDSGDLWKEVHLNLRGMHNVLNGLAVIALARTIGVSEEALRGAFQRFQGVKRRLICTGVSQGITILDDYAHHPTEIATVLSTLRTTLPPDQKIIAVCQPHRYTRLRDYMEEFTQCFAEADSVLLLPLYAAREPEISGVNSDVLYHKLRAEGVQVTLADPSPAALAALVLDGAKAGDMVVCMGAGDITDIAYKLPALMDAITQARE